MDWNNEFLFVITLCVCLIQICYIWLWTERKYIWFQGESYYNDLIPPTLDKLDKLGLIQEDDGARVIFVEGANIPIIAVKRDGGYNYSSTDIASLWLVYTFSVLISKLIPIVWVTGSIQWLNFVLVC